MTTGGVVFWRSAGVEPLLGLAGPLLHDRDGIVQSLLPALGGPAGAEARGQGSGGHGDEHCHNGRSGREAECGHESQESGDLLRLHRQRPVSPRSLGVPGHTAFE